MILINGQRVLVKRSQAGRAGGEVTLSGKSSIFGSCFKSSTWGTQRTGVTVWTPGRIHNTGNQILKGYPCASRGKETTFSFCLGIGTKGQRQL